MDLVDDHELPCGVFPELVFRVDEDEAPLGAPALAAGEEVPRHLRGGVEVGRVDVPHGNDLLPGGGDVVAALRRLVLGVRIGSRRRSFLRRPSGSLCPQNTRSPRS